MRVSKTDGFRQPVFQQPYHVSSNRNHENTIAFLTDLASRLNNRVQISTDAMNAYEDAIELAFGTAKAIVLQSRVQPNEKAAPGDESCLCL